MGEEDDEDKRARFAAQFRQNDLRAELTPEQWIQHAGLFMEQAHRMVSTLFKAMEELAPILLKPGEPIGGLIAGIGLSLQMLDVSAKRYMEAHGIVPLDLRTEQVRIAREALARTDLPEPMRAIMLDVLADNLAEPDTTEDPDWPAVVGEGNN